jgi:hypothetical protein
MEPKKPKPVLKLDSAYDVHALLDFLLVETVVERKQTGRRLSLPHSAVIESDEEYPDAQLVIEIYTYWDAKGSKDDRTEEPARANKTSTRH